MSLPIFASVLVTWETTERKQHLIVKSCTILALGRWFHSSEFLLLLQSTQVWLPAPIWRLTTVSFRGPNDLF